MEKVYSVTEMKKIDANACLSASGAGRGLIGRAGEGIFRAAVSYREANGASGMTPRGGIGSIAVVCGVGGNGGDGFAIALNAAAAGILCRVFLTGEKLSPDAEYYYMRCLDTGIQCGLISDETDLSGYNMIFDCIFGIGFHGAVSGVAALAVKKINESGVFTVSADINSGLSAVSGQSGEYCVKSDLTVAVGFYKYGHILCDAKDKIGALARVGCGMEELFSGACLPDAGDFGDIIAHRKNSSHKGTYGTAAVMGGSTEYSGAVKLANLSLSAVLCGCGVSRLIAPKSLAVAVSPYLLESTLYPLDDTDGHILYDEAKIDGALSRVSALSVGMGWGKSENNIKIIRYIIDNYRIPVIIDADGLNAITDVDILNDAAANVILTPHPAEFSRLSGYGIDEILSDPVAHAVKFAQEHRVTVLLKGTATVITDGDAVYIVNRGCPGMATAGSGDVLSGVMAGLFAYSSSGSVRTAAAAAWICGRAGELAQTGVNEISMRASDTVGAIPDAISEMLAASDNGANPR